MMNHTIDEEDAEASEGHSSVFEPKESAVAAPKEVTLAKEEDRAVFWLRFLAAIVLIVVAVGVSLIVYIQGNESEKNDFEESFEQLGDKIVSSFEKDFKERIGIIESFAADMTSEVGSDPNTTWPFYTPPDFERRAGMVVELTKMLALVMLPVVATEEKRDWEIYAQQNSGWIQEGLAVQRGVEIEEVTDVRPFSPVIFAVIDSQPRPEMGPGPYFPIWTSYPALPQRPINLNPYGNVERGRKSIDIVLDTGKAAFPASRAFLDEETREQEFSFQTYRTVDPTYNGDPFAGSFFPIFDSFDDDKEIAAVMIATVPWKTYFEALLPDGTERIVLILENNCNQVYTYEVVGTESYLIDEGDLHDTKYDSMAVQTNIDALIGLDAGDGGTVGGNCRYVLRVYPSDDFEQSYYSNKPLAYSLSIAGAFLFTCAVFFLYDKMVERRQKVVLTSAEKSAGIVSSLFPENVRERLYEEQEAKRKQSKPRGWEAKTSTEELTDSSAEDTRKEAIASLYENTSIIFADLVGFTKWSSSRTPAEVFELLENLYGAFDEIASRYGVFKVETIGDCYMAVTGLPEPQADHAVIMCKFARSCISRLHMVTASLVDKLGEGTMNLELRVGIHSGPVTAGVLRGQKSRFQLFGDSVNTAARMETNGAGGRVHVSDATASALRVAGKNHWLTERADKIVAKGKGEMITYWVNITSKPGPSTIGGSSVHGKSETSSSNQGKSDTS